MKKELLETFNRLFKGCKLYCIQLDGFSHTAFYKDSDGNKHIGVYSGYASACEVRNEELYSDGVYRAYSTDRLKALFMGYPNYCFQNNAQEIIYENIKNW